MTWRDESSREIRILSYNAEDGLGDAAKGPAIVEWLTAQQPTIAVVTRAYKAAQPGELDDTLKTLRGKDYQVLHQAQDTDRGEPDTHGILMFASNKHVLSMRLVPLAGRYAARAELRDPQTRRHYMVFGYEGNETSEQARLHDITVLQGYIARARERNQAPSIVATEAHAMRRKGVIPRLLYATAVCTRPLPTHPAATQDWSGGPVGWVERRMMAAHKRASTATGDAYRAYLKGAGDLALHNTDDSMAPTTRVGGLPVKTMHILATSDVATNAHQVLSPRASDGPARSLGGNAVLASLRLQFNYKWS